jgi:hypothetical protein
LLRAAAACWERHQRREPAAAASGGGPAPGGGRGGAKKWLCLSYPLVLAVTLQQDVEEVLASCDAYTDRWIAQVPWPEREKIRFVYAMM